MARAAMAHLISDLRRKVYDYLPETLDASNYMIGDAVRLAHQFRDLASAAATAANARAKIFSPANATMVASATMAVSTATGMRYYDFQSSTGMSQGIWRGEFWASVGSVIRRGMQQFELRTSQHIWTPDEMQRALDRHRMFVGGPRELLARDDTYKRYWSEFDSFEWASLYTDATKTGTEVSGATKDLLVGEFTFTTAQDKNLYVEGHVFNIYAAAAELLEELAADPNRAAIWSRGAVSVTGSQPLELATYYRRLAHGGRTVRTKRVYY